MCALLASRRAQSLLLFNYISNENYLWTASEYIICIKGVQNTLFHYRLRVVVLAAIIFGYVEVSIASYTIHNL
jgi:hypothetical protein